MSTGRIVGLVPARSGSEGIADKNIAPLGGKPLIAWSIEAGLNCPGLDAVYLSSDSDRYLIIGAEYGAVPFKRDPRFAGNESTMQSVVRNFVATLEAEGEVLDGVCVLYPTYPFRTGADLDAAVRVFRDAGSDRSVIAMKPPETHPYLCFTVDEQRSVSPFVPYDIDRYYRRQQYPDCRELTMWVCLVPARGIDGLNAQMMDARSVAYEVPDHAVTLDIDTPRDFAFAEFILERGLWKPD